MKIVSPTFELTFNDVLLLPRKSDFTMIEDVKKTDLKTRISKKLEIDIPICSSPMSHVTEVNMAIAMGKLGGIGFVHCFMSPEKQLYQVKEIKKNKVKVAVSVSDFSKAGLKHVGHLLKLGTDLICIETAHGFNIQTIDFLKQIKTNYPNSQVCVSLVVTGEATRALIKAGADSIRVGIGGGSHCTTRLITGVGRPQLSAIKECYLAAKKHGVPIISDTGIEHAGDIAKALAFGADEVMIGGLFTATKETPGDLIRKKNRVYKFSAGMCSDQSQHKNSIDPRQIFHKTKDVIKRILYLNENNSDFVSPYKIPFKFTHEGVSSLIPYKGSVVSIFNELTGGLRRSMWYLGCKNISEIKRKSQVVIVSPSTQKDNVPRI